MALVHLNGLRDATRFTCSNQRQAWRSLGAHTPRLSDVLIRTYVNTLMSLYSLHVQTEPSEYLNTSDKLARIWKTAVKGTSPLEKTKASKGSFKIPQAYVQAVMDAMTAMPTPTYKLWTS
jgi:hypothetical protein